MKQRVIHNQLVRFPIYRSPRTANSTHEVCAVPYYDHCWVVELLYKDESREDEAGSKAEPLVAG